MGTLARTILVLYWSEDPGEMRPAIRHHLRALEASEAGHRIAYYNVVRGCPAWLGRLRCDVLLLHTTLLCLRWTRHFSRFRQQLSWLRSLDCFKIALPQDEYDHAEVLDDWLCELGVSAIGSNFDERYRATLYPRMHSRARFLKCLTGYIDERTARSCARQMLPLADRPLDIVYRACRLPYWFGSHGQFKHQIAQVVSERARAKGFRCDVSTRPADTIVGARWFAFLASSRVTIGCESGSSVLDRRGGLQQAIQAMLQQRPDLPWEQVSARLPAGWDDHRFFAIGPRHLEAIITRTCQVLVEGEYDGVLLPNRHYLPLKRDFSNLDEVLDKLRDLELLTGIATRAYEDIYRSGTYSYAALARNLESVFPAPGVPRGASCLPWPVVKLMTRTAEWKTTRRVAFRKVVKRCAGGALQVIRDGVRALRSRAG